MSTAISQISLALFQKVKNTKDQTSKPQENRALTD